MHPTSLRLIKSETNPYLNAETQGNAASVHNAYSDNLASESFKQYKLFNERDFLQQRKNQSKPNAKRWLANVSQQQQLKKTELNAINVVPTANKNDFDIIKSLLIAKTCHTIMFDKRLTIDQTKELKSLALFSGTKLAFIYDAQDYSEYLETLVKH